MLELKIKQEPYVMSGELRKIENGKPTIYVVKEWYEALAQDDLNNDYMVYWAVINEDGDANFDKVYMVLDANGKDVRNFKIEDLNGDYLYPFRDLNNLFTTDDIDLKSWRGWNTFKTNNTYLTVCIIEDNRVFINEKIKEDLYLVRIYNSKKDMEYGRNYYDYWNTKDKILDDMNEDLIKGEFI